MHDADAAGEAGGAERGGGERGWRRPLVRRAGYAALLFALWLGLSGLIEGLFLLSGAVCSVIAMLIAERIFRPAAPAGFGSAPPGFGWFVASWLRFAAYLPWLLWQIVLANLHVARLVLDPRLPIDPALVEFDSTLKTEAAHALLANSITLTPGTVTVEMTARRFVVHCLSAGSRRGIEEGALLRRVEWVFGEGGGAPAVREAEVLEEAPE
ncbi:MAG: Na+/H+ antiporter subunit E [Chloroflexota bacterium]|nr:Na+/H+ antiporter subunit E [Chloroflexota bacterium]